MSRTRPSLWKYSARAHNNSPFPREECGAGGLQFAASLPQSLAFSRAFLIQRKHPRQNKTSAICSISPCFPPQSRWLSTGACSASAEHWSIWASNQNINCLNLETFDELQASSYANVLVCRIADPLTFYALQHILEIPYIITLNTGLCIQHCEHNHHGDNGLHYCC